MQTGLRTQMLINILIAFAFAFKQIIACLNKFSSFLQKRILIAFINLNEMRWTRNDIYYDQLWTGISRVESSVLW